MHNLILILSGLVLAVLCLIIIVSNHRRTVNRWLAAFLLSGFLWLFANLLTNLATSPEVSLFFARTTLIGAVLLPLTFLFFSLAYINRKITVYSLAKWSAVPLGLLFFTFTPLNIAEIKAHGQGTVTGPLYYALILVILSYFATGFYLLREFYKSASLLQKNQLKYMFSGLILTLIPGIIANAILPLAGYSKAVFYGPNVVVIFSIFVAVAIVKHRLLDVKLVVARAVGYILLIASLIALVVGALSGISAIFFNEESIGLKVHLTYAAVAILAAFALPPLKRFFDRTTNRFFYRDAYDPQTLLDNLNTTLVTVIELDELVTKSAGLLQSTLKSDFCLFAIRDSHNSALRLIGVAKGGLTAEVASQIDNAFSNYSQKIIVSEELEPTSPVAGILRNNGVSVFIKMRALLKSHGGQVPTNPGFILLGSKQSGSLYSNKDIKILEIIAGEMAIAIQNSLRFEEISKFNITLQQKINEATQELQQANTRLQELDHTKDEFISMASHQLRTPLTAVKGYLSMVLDGDVGPVTQNEKEMIQRAFDSAQRMVYLISDLLNVSRLQSGKFVIDNKPTNLADVVEAEISQLQDSIQNHQLKFDFNKPKNFPIAMLDETKIRQVIMNFLDNAIYYTPAGGSITVSVEATDTALVYTVTDTGLGVPKPEQPKLFTKFFRAGNARKARPDGTGLGLFMAKKVVVAQGGAIIFKSVEGKGSTFGFSFPRSSVEIRK
ncbi:MAG: ATP-binding protein [Candidatus Saccharimonadales bacterium]